MGVTPVEKMIEVVEKSLLSGNLGNLSEAQKTEMMNHWQEVKSKFICYERDYLEQAQQNYNAQAAEVLKENKRLKWLLNVVVDRNLERGE